MGIKAKYFLLVGKGKDCLSCGGLMLGLKELLAHLLVAALGISVPWASLSLTVEEGIKASESLTPSPVHTYFVEFCMFIEGNSS